MIQLILHLIGDYVLQSQWMAENKTKSSFAAASHAFVYSLPFLFLEPSWLAFQVILLTHFLIDRFSLAKYVVWLKNVVLNPDFWKWWANQNRTDKLWNIWPRHSWSNCSATGYPADLPPWLSVWLLIACDNTLHLVINCAALKWL